jgi:hypothetical protein
MAAACDPRPVTTVACARGADAIAATPSLNALSNALSALEFHSIEAILIFCTTRARDP